MTPQLDTALFGASHLLDEVKMRYDELGLTKAFTDFQGHVAARAPALTTVNAYVATFVPAVLEGLPCVKFKRERRQAVKKKLAELERALAYLYCLGLKSPKPARELLLAAQDCIDRADKEMAAEKEAIENALQARRTGGRARQAKLDPVRNYFACWLLERRSESGWKSKSAAANSAVADVVAFAREGRYSTAGGEDFAKTLVRWINSVPEVRVAYEHN